MFIQSSSLCKLPHEIFENIVLELISDDGPIIPLLQSCKQINNILAFPRNTHLYSRIFRYRFNSAASARRLGARTHHSRHLTHQLAWYSKALKCIRRADIYDNGVLDAFWASFALMSENDGKNRHLLEAAGLPDFVDEFVRKRLYEDSANTNGWPNESPINCLALWLLWFTSTEGMSSYLSSTPFSQYTLRASQSRVYRPTQRDNQTCPPFCHRSLSRKPLSIVQAYLITPP